MAQKADSSPVVVGKDNFLYADGVKIGRFDAGKQTIQFLDRDRRRCLIKGREVVEVKVSDLAGLPQQAKSLTK